MEENDQSAVADNLAEEPGNSAPAASAEDATAQLAEERAALQDRLLRLQAEFDNYRKRTERERVEFAEYAGEQTVKVLLPVLDDLERALKAAPADNDFVRGVELIYTRLLDALKKQGLEPIEALGVAFDPHKHEAIGRLETTEHEDNTVVQEYGRGYNYKGRLLRPAMVQVAVKP